MRPALQRLFVLVAMVLGFAAHAAHADDRADARAHYQAGVKAYSGADYRAATKEFSAAQQLAPADLNNYNLALCYDKLGEAESAIQYYRSYLDRVPSTDKRAEIEASIQRLDGAVKSLAAKKAAEAQAAADAKAAEQQRKADEMKKAEAEAHAAEDARKAEEARKQAEADAKRPSVGPGVGPAVAPAGGSTGTVGTGVAVTTGDAQLDRAQAIDINAIRDQRLGGGASGMVDPRGGPAMGAQPRTYPGTSTALAPQPATGPAVTANGPQPADQPKKLDPIYKKWWFWAVVAVGAYVVYEVAVSGPSNSTTAREAPLHGVSQAPRPSGLTLFSW